jgi:hypothetical protein
LAGPTTTSLQNISILLVTMALTATAQPFPLTSHPGWDESIVPALRKRIFISSFRSLFTLSLLDTQV